MGYYTMLTGEVIIDKKNYEKVKADIEFNRQKTQREKNNCEYIHWHIAESEVASYFEDEKGLPTKHKPEGEWYRYPLGIEIFIIDPNVECEDKKWYGLDEYIEWLNKYAIGGEIVWQGEEHGDIGGIKWKDGKVYERVFEWKERRPIK